MFASLTDHDREILLAQISDKIEQLRPITTLGLPWRATFEKAVTEWRAKGNSQPDGSDYQRECFAWALAHSYLLETTDQKGA